MNDCKLNIEEEALKHRGNAQLVIETFKTQKDIELRYDSQSLEILEDYITNIKGHFDTDYSGESEPLFRLKVSHPESGFIF